MLNSVSLDDQVHAVSEIIRKRGRTMSSTQLRNLEAARHTLYRLSTLSKHFVASHEEAGEDCVSEEMADDLIDLLQLQKA